MLPANIAGWLDIFVKSAAVFAGVFAIYQYLEARQDLRVLRTLEYVGRFNDHDTSVGRARAAISRALWRNDTQILRLREILRTLPEDEAEALGHRFIRKILEDGGVKGDLHTVVQFFDALHICIEWQHCQAQPAYAFFGDYAETLWGNFGDAVIHNRGLDENYGAGLEHVLRDAAATPGLELPPAAGD